MTSNDCPSCHPQPATMSLVLGYDMEIILVKKRIKHIMTLSTSIWDLLELPVTVTLLAFQNSFFLL